MRQPQRAFRGVTNEQTIPVWMAVENYKLLAVFNPQPCQISNPFSRPKSLSDVSGRAPRCWIISAAASAPSRAAVQ